MVPVMVELVRDGIGNDIDQIGNDAGQQVQGTVSKNEMMAALVNEEVEAQAGNDAGGKGHGGDKPPGVIVQRDREGELGRGQSEDAGQGPRIVANQLADFGVLLED